MLGITHTYVDRIPYWAHNGHTATVVDFIDQGDGTADVTWRCDCEATWTVATGVDHSEEPPEG